MVTKKVAKQSRFDTARDSRYTLVILAAKRARQINDYLNSIKRHELTEVRGPEIDLIDEKPLTIAFGEIAQGKVTYERIEDNLKS